MSEITELRLALTAEDERNIFGGNDSYIRKIEDSLHVEIIDRNGELLLQVAAAKHLHAVQGLFDQALLDQGFHYLSHSLGKTDKTEDSRTEKIYRRYQK